MELIIQIKSLVISCLLGIFISMTYSFINRLFYRLRRNILRYIIEIIMMICFSYVYVITVVYVNDGIITLYMMITFLIGIYLYEKYYAKHFLVLYEAILRLLRYILSPFIFIFRKICVILKKIRNRVIRWQRKKRKK